MNTNFLGSLASKGHITLQNPFMQPPNILGSSSAGLFNSKPADSAYSSYPSANLASGADSFSRQTSIMTEGQVSPDGSGIMRFRVEITPTGMILQKTLAGVQLIGQVNTQGNFYLANGAQGNIFSDGRVIVDFEKQENPFLEALAATQRQRAVTGSEIPVIRSHMSPYGLTGQGIKVGILDSLEEDKSQPSGGKISNHSKTVGTVINHPTWGVAPGAQLVSLGHISQPTQELPDNPHPQIYFNFLVQKILPVYANATNAISRAIQSEDPGLRVLNLTQSTNKCILINSIFRDLDSKDDQGNFKYPQLRQALFGPALAGSIEDKARAIHTFVDQLFASPQLQRHTCNM
jgi:hypothetical protein